MYPVAHSLPLALQLMLKEAGVWGDCLERPVGFPNEAVLSVGFLHLLSSAASCVGYSISL